MSKWNEVIQSDAFKALSSNHAAPSQTPEAAGLEDAGHIALWKAGGVSYYPKGENFTVSASCRVEPLVTAASAQAAIDAEKARADRLAKAGDRLIDALHRYGFPVSGGARVALTDRGSAEAVELDEAASNFRAALQQETQP